jgi:penicillin G amidase
MGIVPPFKWLWNIGPYPFGGDISTVNPGYYTSIIDRPFKTTNGASMRHIVDFGEFDEGRFVITTGESGRWMSPHYDDQTELWMDVEYHPMWMEKSKIEENSTGKTLFVPEGN